MESLSDLAGRENLRQFVGPVGDGRRGGRSTPPPTGHTPEPTPDPDCERCGGAGFLEEENLRRWQTYDAKTRTYAWEEKTFTERRICRCMCRPIPVVRSADECGLGGKLEQMTLDGVESWRMQAQTWQALQAWAAGFPQSLKARDGWLFLGPWGTGKSGLMAALLHEARLKGIRVRYVRETALVKEIKGSWDQSEDRAQSESAILDSLCLVPVLGIDDVGKAHVPGSANPQEGNAWLASVLYNVIDERLTQGRPTLLTTNLSTEALTRRLGDALMDRVDTFGVVEMTGESRRGVGARS